MRKSIEHLKKNTSIYVPIFITLACVLFLPIFYHEVDDRFLQDIVMSASYNEHSEFLHMIGVPLGYVVRVLTLAVPFVNWLAILYYAAVTFGFASFYAFVDKIGDKKTNRFFIYLILILLQISVFAHMTFTVVSFVCFAGSVVFGLTHIKTIKDIGYMIPMFFLCALSAMLRYNKQILYVVFAFSLVLIFYMVYKKKTSLICAIMILSMLLAGPVCARKVCQWHAESIGMTQINRYHTARGNITDTARFEYEDVEQILKEKDVSQNDLKMIRQLLLCDLSVIDESLLKDIGEAQTFENKYNFNFIQIFKAIVCNSYVLLALILFVVFVLLSPKRWFWFSGFFGGLIVFVAYLNARQRAEIRVVFPIVIVAVVYMLLCYSETHEQWMIDKVFKSKKSLQRLRLFGVVMFVAILGLISLNQYRKLYIEYHALESRHEIFDYAKENPDKYITASAWTRNWLYSKRVNILTRNVKEHAIHSPYGDWYLYFPYYYARMEKLGLGAYAEKALMLPIEHPDCYFLALNQDEIEMLVTYYKEHYNQNVQAEELKSFNDDRFKLYKFHVVENLN